MLSRKCQTPRMSTGKLPPTNLTVSEQWKTSSVHMHIAGTCVHVHVTVTCLIDEKNGEPPSPSTHNKKTFY